MAERSDGLVFSYLLWNSIVSCIADLEGNPDRDYSIFRIDSLYHTALRFDKAFELDESFTDLISQAKNLLFECHVGTELLNTLYVHKPMA